MEILFGNWTLCNGFVNFKCDKSLGARMVKQKINLFTYWSLVVSSKYTGILSKR